MDALLGVGPVGDLVDVVADGCQFPQQRGVLVRRAGAKLDAGNRLADERAGGQAGNCALFMQMGKLSISQPDTDKMFSFSQCTSNNPKCVSP